MRNRPLPVFASLSALLCASIVVLSATGAATARRCFFNEGEYEPDASKSETWNRGGYLVQGLGHCSMCHSPINALGGSSDSKAFEGGLILTQNWYAPSLTSDKEAGLGDWSIEAIIDAPCHAPDIQPSPK